MKLRCQRRDREKEKSYHDIEIRVDKKSFYEWVIPEIEAFLKLNPTEVPSIDRRDSKGHYELDNLRVISFTENSRLSTARIESAFSKMTELYGEESLSKRQEIFDYFVKRSKEALGLDQ